MAEDNAPRRFRQDQARRLRASMTPAERRLWRELYRIPLEGTHFRRQVAIGPYVADFACLAVRLVIEIDGGHHSEDAQHQHDAQRTRFLEAEGFRVLRFWNHQVITELASVLDTIHQAVFLRGEPEARLTHRRARRPHPTPGRSATRPSPSRGG